MYGSYDHFGTYAYSAPTPTNITANPGVAGTLNALEAITLTRVALQITTAVNYDSAEPTLCRVAFKRYVNYGSSSGAKTLALFDIPDGLAAGKLLFVDIPNKAPDRNAEIKAGEQVVAEVTVKGVGGTNIAGAFVPVFIYHPRPETVENQSNLVMATNLV